MFATSIAPGSPRLSLSLISGILTKLAKHLALIACLMIVGEASGRSSLGEVIIFLIVLASVAVHSFARALQRRLPIDVCCPASMPNKSGAQKDLRGEARDKSTSGVVRSQRVRLCENSVHGSTLRLGSGQAGLATNGSQTLQIKYLTVRPELRRRAPDEFFYTV